MKRLIGVIISGVILVGILAGSVSAAGKLIFSDSFDMGCKPANWILGEYGWDEYQQCVQGYEPARVLQSNFLARNSRKWDQFYGKFDVQVRGFDDIVETDKTHVFKIWYRDLFENPDDEVGAVYYYGVEIETGRVFLTKEHDFRYRDHNGIAQSGSIRSLIAEGQLPAALEVGENAPWYEIGIRVTTGKIECLFEGEVVITAMADENDDKLGNFAINSVDSTVGSQKSPFIVFNGEQSAAMWIALDNFEIWTPDYDFKAYGDVNADGSVTLTDVSKLLQYVAKWNVEGFDAAAADVTGDGSVNLTDASRMLQYIAKWNVTLGPTE